MKPRKKKITVGVRRPLKCVGGPLSGAVLWLGTPGTLPFFVKGESGRYNQKMEWEATP